MKFKKDVMVRVYIFLFLVLLLHFCSNILADFLNLSRNFYFTNTMFYFFLILSGVVFVYSRKNKLNLYSYKTDYLSSLLFIVLAYFCFILYFYLTFLSKSLMISNLFFVVLFSTLLYLLVIVLLIMAVFGRDFFMTFKQDLFFLIMIIILFFLVSLILRFNGNAIADLSTKAVYFFITKSFDPYATQKGISLSSENFGVDIGIACSGIESMTLFTGLFLIILFLEWNNFKSRAKLFIWFLVGLFITFLLNVLRLFTLMYIGARHSADFALNMFHSNASWILFVIFVFVYIKYFYEKNIK